MDVNGEAKIEVPPLLKAPLRKPSFEYDCLTKIPGVSPLARTTADFDFEEVCRALGEKLEGTAINHALLADVMAELLAWITRGCASGRVDLDIIGRRAVALAWVVNPSIFEGVHASKIAEFTGFPIENLTDKSGASAALPGK